MEYTKKSTTSSEQMLHQKLTHLTDYLNVIKRHKWLLILLLFIIVSVVTIYSFTSTPMYKATATILIDKKPPKLLNGNEFPSINVGIEEEYLETEYNLLKSRSLANKVIHDLQLEKYFKANQKPGYLSEVLDKLKKLSATVDISDGESETSNYLTLVLNKIKGLLASANVEVNEERLNEEQIIINWYLENLEIKPVRGSQLVSVGFAGTSPEMVTRVANAHVKKFIEWNLESQLLPMKKGLDLLASKLKEHKAELDRSYLKIPGDILPYTLNQDVNDINNQDIISQQIIELNAKLTEVRAERIAKQTAYEQLKEFTLNQERIFSLPVPEMRQDPIIQNIKSLPEIAQNPVVQQLRSQLTELKVQQSEIKNRYTNDHPTMREMNSRIKSLENEIVKEVEQVKRTIKIELERAATLEKSVKQELEEQKQLLTSLQKKAIQYGALTQEMESKHQFYEIMLKQVEATNLTNAIEASNIRIIDKAEKPRFPYKPKKLLYVVAAIILSLLIGSGIAFFWEYMDNTIKNPEDVQKYLGMSVQGIIPYDKSLKKCNNSYLVSLDTSSKKCKKQSQSYAYSKDVANRFLMNLQLPHHRAPAKIVLLESATSGEGKTTVLSKSAVKLAKRGLRVLMVDADLQHPTLHQMFHVYNKSGLIDAMSNVFSQELAKGELKQYSIDDLFSIIALKKQSGTLKVTDNSQTMKIVFEKGHLLHIENQDNPTSNRLGTMLLNGGFITESQLQDALERKQRTGLPLGYILINSGYVNREKLQGPLKLQIEEQLQKLFSWKEGSFIFLPSTVESHEDKKIYFRDDYTSIIHNLGKIEGSRFLKQEVLNHVKPLNESNLWLLPAGITKTMFSEPMCLSLFSKLLDILKRHFDIILVDAPPLLDASDSMFLPSIADRIIFVVKAGHLSVNAINEATNCLKEVKSNALGVVLNQVRVA